MAFGTGCMTRADGRTLQANVAAMTERMDALEQRLAAQEAELARLLETANVVLLRNSADQGLALQQLRDQLSLLEGQMAETRHLAEMAERQTTEQRREMTEQRQQLDAQRQEIERRVDQIARAAGMDVTLQPSEIPRDQAAHFQAGSQALRVGSHSYARALFREYVIRYPADERADDAQYGIGSSYLQQNQPAAALGEFRRVLTTYRTGDVMDKTLADMAEAFVQVRACNDARQSLEGLIAAYPDSPLVARARTRLRDISRLPARACAE
jgi:TolA-binding protein